ncbi:MAG TPA: hypothetical protein VHG09_01640 [Longimicrobiales bacterium]|nr:hypothetical protein [Longimicrobiales bacterium]
MAKQYPWWLVGGTETCHVCNHQYSYEVGLYCIACDRGLCAQCVLIERSTREPWCRECHENEREA